MPLAAPVVAEDSVLLIDDDTELCSMLQSYLSRHGWVVTARHTGESGLKTAVEGQYRIVLLDVMLPDFDGFEVLRRLRQRSQVSVMLLTARGEDVDRIVGLELGADDYLPKPFNARELLARMRAVTRRQNSFDHAAPQKSANSMGFTVDQARRIVSFGDRPLELTDVEFLLLAKFLEKPCQIVSREELTEKVLERPFRPLDRSVDMHISRLRKKLESLKNFSGGIRGIRNSGYMLSGSAEGGD